MKTVYKILDSHGRIVLPQELREQVDMQKNDIVELSVVKNAIKIEKMDIVKLNDNSDDSKRNTIMQLAKQLDRASLLTFAKKFVELAEKEENDD